MMQRATRRLERMSREVGGSSHRGSRCATAATGMPKRRVSQQQQQFVQTRGFKRITAVIMGAPGSGKGTISGKILRDFPFAHISTGDLLRDEIQAGSDVGTKAKTFMDQGKFVPDDIIFELLLAAVCRAEDQDEHIMLDGFPRSTSQAIALKEHLSVEMVMNLDVPRDIIVDRLSDRWIHPASGRVYAYAYRPPKEKGKDDVTGEDLVRRDDDQPEVVERRLAKYERTTRPLLELYRQEGILHSFSGDKSDTIYEEMQNFLSEALPTSRCA